jgi:hypothetical protein
MRGMKIYRAREAALQLASRLRPNDRLALIRFDRSAKIVFDFTSDQEAMGRGIRSVRVGNQDTALYDALELASRVSWGSRPGRRAVVVLSDGENNAGDFLPEDVISKAVQRGIPIYAIAQGKPESLLALKRIAALTDGKFYPAQRPDDFEALYGTLWNRLTDVYRAWIQIPPGLTRVRSLEVKWNRAGGRSPAAARLLNLPLTPPPNRPPLPLEGMTVLGLAGIGAVGMLWAFKRQGQRKKAVAPIPNSPGAAGEKASLFERAPSGSEEDLTAFRDFPRRDTLLLAGQRQNRLAWLYIVNGPLKGREFFIERESLIGRSPSADIALTEDEEVSRRHAKLVQNQEGRFTLVDLASANGVWRNGEAVVQAILKDGDRIRIGATEAVFKTTAAEVLASLSLIRLPEIGLPEIGLPEIGLP